MILTFLTLLQSQAAVTGTVSQVLPSLNQSASGTVSDADIAGISAQTLPHIVQSAIGNLEHSGIINQTLPHVTQHGIGTVEKFAEGPANQTLPSIKQRASGKVFKLIFEAPVKRELEVEDSTLEFALKEVSKDDCEYDLLQKVIQTLSLKLTHPEANAGIAVLQDAFVDSVNVSYAVKETGAGITIGLFKNIGGMLTQIDLALPGEMMLIKGNGIDELIPPEGWRIIADTEVQSRYNVGASPTWKVAAVEYIGI